MAKKWSEIRRKGSQTITPDKNPDVVEGTTTVPLAPPSDALPPYEVDRDGVPGDHWEFTDEEWEETVGPTTRFARAVQTFAWEVVSAGGRLCWWGLVWTIIGVYVVVQGIRDSWRAWRDE